MEMFIEYSAGPSARSAFLVLKNRLAEEGGFAVSAGCVEFELPVRVSAEKVVEQLSVLSSDDESPSGVRRSEKATAWLVDRLGADVTGLMLDAFFDVSGPCVALPVSGRGRDRFRLFNKVGVRDKVWLFAGCLL